MWNKSKPKPKTSVQKKPLKTSNLSLIERAFWFLTFRIFAFGGGAIACVLITHWTFIGINQGSAEFVQRATEPANKFIIEVIGRAAGIAFIQEANATLPYIAKTPEELKDWEKNLLSRENELITVTAIYTKAMEIYRKCQETATFRVKHEEICSELSDAEMHASVKNPRRAK